MGKNIKIAILIVYAAFASYLWFQAKHFLRAPAGADTEASPEIVKGWMSARMALIGLASVATLGFIYLSRAFFKKTSSGRLPT